MPQVHGGDDALGEDAGRIVFANLKFIAHHRHFGRQVRLANEGIDHPIRFHRQRPVEILVGGGENFIVVGAVIPGRCIPLRAALGKFVGDLRMFFRAFEKHVFEQMRHAGLAVIFVARADFVGDVHHDLRLGGIRRDQDLEAVWQSVLGDALDRGDFADAFW